MNTLTDLSQYLSGINGFLIMCGFLAVICGIFLILNLRSYLNTRKSLPFLYDTIEAAIEGRDLPKCQIPNINISRLDAYLRPILEDYVKLKRLSLNEKVLERFLRKCGDDGGKILTSFGKFRVMPISEKKYNSLFSPETIKTIEKEFDMRFEDIEKLVGEQIKRGFLVMGPIGEIIKRKEVSIPFKCPHGEFSCKYVNSDGYQDRFCSACLQNPNSKMDDVLASITHRTIYPNNIEPYYPKEKELCNKTVIIGSNECNGCFFNMGHGKSSKGPWIKCARMSI